MLSHDHRLHRPTEFTEVVRRGRRSSRPLLTVHFLLATEPVSAPAGPARAGLVISKAVGGAVVRHQVARRLRPLLRDRIATMPPGVRVVVRAAPAAGCATSAALGVDLDSALAAAGRDRQRS